MVKFKDFSRSLSDFRVLFKADLFSRTFQESPLNSSTFQACANPVQRQQLDVKKFAGNLGISMLCSFQNKRAIVALNRSPVYFSHFP